MLCSGCVCVVYEVRMRCVCVVYEVCVLCRGCVCESLNPNYIIAPKRLHAIPTPQVAYMCIS